MGGRGGLLPGGPFASIFLVALFAVTLIVLAIAFCQLYRKTGFSGAIGLLMLVPLVNLGVALYLAFAEWPVLAELARVKLIAASAPFAATTDPMRSASSSASVDATGAVVPPKS
jgi:ABC-type spermidine/putrescine transport system permease subunit II